MVKLIHHEMPKRRIFQYKRLEMPVIIILLTGSISYLLYSALSHNADNLLCQCLFCVINHTPEDGDYLYNRYLVIISLAWTAAVFGLLLLVKHLMEKKHKR